MEKLHARNLFGEITYQRAEKIKDPRQYWIREILGHIKETNPKATYMSVLWRINKSLVPCDESACRVLHFALLGSMKDPRCPYQSYSHAFDARTKT